MNRLILILSIYFLRNLLIRCNNPLVENSHENQEISSILVSPKLNVNLSQPSKLVNLGNSLENHSFHNT